MKKIILNVIGIAIFMTLLACGSHEKLTVQEKRSPQELMQAGNQLYAQGDYKDALETYNRLLIFYPTSDLDIEAKLHIAQCYAKLEKYEKQMDILLQLLKENLIPEYVPNIYLQIGEYYETAAHFNVESEKGDSTDYQTAIDYYDKAIHYEDSKNKDAKIEARYRKALVEAKMGKTDLAKQYYQEIVDKFPNSPFAVLAQIKLLNPTDTSELSTDPEYLAIYKKRLAQAGVAAQPTKGKVLETTGSKEQSFQEYLNQNPVDTTATSVSADTTTTPVSTDTTATPASVDTTNTPVSGDTTATMNSDTTQTQTPAEPDTTR